jgi:hypothetical protein
MINLYEKMKNTTSLHPWALIMQDEFKDYVPKIYMFSVDNVTLFINDYKLMEEIL